MQWGGAYVCVVCFGQTRQGMDSCEDRHPPCLLDGSTQLAQHPLCSLLNPPPVLCLRAGGADARRPHCPRPPPPAVLQAGTAGASWQRQLGERAAVQPAIFLPVKVCREEE